MTVDTTELRRWGNATAQWVAEDKPHVTMETAAELAPLALEAATELEQLRSALAAVPHAELCRLLMTRDDEPCSCEKSAIVTQQQGNPLVIPDATSVTYLAARRLDVHGPVGRLVGVLGITGVHVEQHDDGRRIQVVFEQGEATT